MKPFTLAILLNTIILKTQQLPYLCNFGAAYVICVVTIESGSRRTPPCAILLRHTVAKIRKAVILNRRARELGVGLVIFYQCSFKSAFDVVRICTAYSKSPVSATRMFGEVSSWLYFAAVLVQILTAVCSSSDIKAALRLKHLAFTAVRYDPLLTCSWCGSSWQHFTLAIVLPPLPALFIKPRR